MVSLKHPGTSVEATFGLAVKKKEEGEGQRGEVNKSFWLVELVKCRPPAAGGENAAAWFVGAFAWLLCCCFFFFVAFCFDGVV